MLEVGREPCGSLAKLLGTRVVSQTKVVRRRVDEAVQVERERDVVVDVAEPPRPRTSARLADSGRGAGATRALLSRRSRRRCARARGRRGCGRTASCSSGARARRRPTASSRGCASPPARAAPRPSPGRRRGRRRSPPARRCADPRPRRPAPSARPTPGPCPQRGQRRSAPSARTLRRRPQAGRGPRAAGRSPRAPRPHRRRPRRSSRGGRAHHRCSCARGVVRTGGVPRVGRRPAWQAGCLQEGFARGSEEGNIRSSAGILSDRPGC